MQNSKVKSQKLLTNYNWHNLSAQQAVNPGSKFFQQTMLIKPSVKIFHCPIFWFCRKAVHYSLRHRDATKIECFLLFHWIVFSYLCLCSKKGDEKQHHQRDWKQVKVQMWWTTFHVAKVVFFSVKVVVRQGNCTIRLNIICSMPFYGKEMKKQSLIKCLNLN